MIFLTLWNLVVQALYMTFAFVTACFMWRDLRAFQSGQGATAAQSSTQEPWHSNDPQQRAATAGRCTECKCLSAEGNWLQDYAWHRWGEAHLSPTTTRLLEHRDRLFYVAVTTGSLVGIGFWGALFPAPQVHDKYFHASSVLLTARTLLDHGFTTGAVVVDAFLVRHRGDTRAVWGVLVLIAFASAYTLWNLLVHHISEHWAYPSIQVHVATLALAARIAVYVLTVALFPSMFLLWRLVLNRYWRCCEARAGRSHSASDVGLGMLAVAPLLGEGGSRAQVGRGRPNQATPSTRPSTSAAGGKRPVYVF
jgi:hypothetical protein